MRLSSSGTGNPDGGDAEGKRPASERNPLPADPSVNGAAAVEVPSEVGSGASARRERHVDPALREPEDLTVIEEGSHSIVLGWTAPKEPAEILFEVERRIPGSADGAWAVVPGVKYDRIERLVKARVGALEPQSGYEFRIITVTDDGRSSSPSEVLAARTVAPESWIFLYGYPALAVLFLLMIAGISTLLLRRRRPQRKGPPPLR